jgi:hypothetical protein
VRRRVLATALGAAAVAGGALPSPAFAKPDGGTTWKRMPGVDAAIGGGFGKAAKRSGYPAIHIATTVRSQEGIFRSTDGGNTRQRINEQNVGNTLGLQIGGLQPDTTRRSRK